MQNASSRPAVQGDHYVKRWAARRRAADVLEVAGGNNHETLSAISFSKELERGDIARLALQPSTGVMHHHTAMMQANYTICRP
jgi:hypothetical protein